MVKTICKILFCNENRFFYWPLRTSPFSFSMYSLGSIPNSFLKHLVKYLGVLNPTSIENLPQQTGDAVDVVLHDN